MALFTWNLKHNKAEIEFDRQLAILIKNDHDDLFILDVRPDSKETSAIHFQRQMGISHYDQWNQTDARWKGREKEKFFLSLSLSVDLSLFTHSFSS